MRQNMERQLKDDEALPVIIGGMVLDIQAASSIPPRPGTTCPGKVQYVPGGVARNVAECMWKLGAKPYMISALGFDMAGMLLLKQWEAAQLSTKGIRKHKDIDTAIVCHILDVKGEVAAGIASVQAIERFLTPEWIEQFRFRINSAPLVMVDANLSRSALEASCKMAAYSNVPVWFEPVSVAKSERIASVVKHITYASPNEDELIAMANAVSPRGVFQPIERKKYSVDGLFQILKPAISLLLEKGIKILVVTIGSNGVFLCSKGAPTVLKSYLGKMKQNVMSKHLFETVISKCPPYQSLGEQNSQFLALHLPAPPASVVRLTGAGDCLVGGMISSLCSGLDVLQSVAVGIATAKATIGVHSNVPSEVSLEAIAGDAAMVYSAARVLLQLSKL